MQRRGARHVHGDGGLEICVRTNFRASGLGSVSQISWCGKVHYSVVPPFGLRSSAAIQERAAELLEWVIVNEVPGIDASHWVDYHFPHVGLVQQKANEIVILFLAIGTQHRVTSCPGKIERPERLMKYV